MTDTVIGFASEDDFGKMRRVVNRGHVEPLSEPNVRPTLVNFPVMLVRPESKITRRTTGTCKIYYAPTQGSEVDVGNTVTAYNAGGDIVEPCWCLAIPRGNGWTLIQLGPSVLWGKTDTAIAKWGDGTVTLWRGFFGVTAGGNPEAAISPAISVSVHAPGVALLDYHRVKLTPIEGLPDIRTFLVEPLECEDDVEARP